MRKITQLCVLLAICFISMLSACASSGSKDISGSGGLAEIKTVFLEDGTECVVIVGYNGAAIDCNWPRR